MKKLKRSQSSRMLLGVAGGIGEYFDVDPTLVRLGWCALGLLWGYGVLLYLLAALVVPSEAKATAGDAAADEADGTGPPEDRGPSGGGRARKKKKAARSDLVSGPADSAHTFTA